MASGAIARRLGPRPLPQHLGLATAIWLSSPAGLPLLKGGSSAWKPRLRPLAEELQASLASADRKRFAAAVEAEGHRRLGALLTGIESYRHHPYRRALADPPVLWQEGSTRLLDYGAAGRRRRAGPAVLVIPSLINQAYVLDLTLDRSLMRHLAGQGMRALLVDWGRPGKLERGFTLTDYIAGRLEGALDAVRGAVDGPIVAVGYCMGGLLALALAERRARDLAGLVCLATPWDFHADQPARAQVTALAGFLFEPVLGVLGELPVDLIQLLFAWLDPFSVIRKFLGFAALDPASPQSELFVALEDWLNDGVALAAPVARECLVGWYGENRPALGRWRVAGRPVRPAELRLPSLVVVPHADRIVPPASAEPLAALLPNATALRPAAGHIGMVVGGGARTRMWAPLVGWLRQCAA